MKTYTIGRDTEAMIQCGDDTVGRIHAEITVTDDGRYYLADRGSLNGTFLLTDNKWRRFTKNYVDTDAVILFGEFKTTISRLLAIADSNAKSAPQKRIMHNPEIRETKRIMRDPETGAIIKS
ncbi:FHA domain-containing protein [Desulfococcaceae bacterium HSG7]|nr:FHA domain-containing protein [Desulfococcaceae bacterium HSG7]